jgi:uncharacterized protein YjbJ (UPF0337 family)
MNRDQAKGAWGLFKGKAKRIWGELVNNEDIFAEGSADRLYGRVQKKFGDAKEIVKAKLDKLQMP